MRKIVSLILAFGAALFYLSPTLAGIPNTSHPTTFLGPTVKGSYTNNLFSGSSAYSIAGEAGVKNWRIGGTVGWGIQENQRLKFSAEYLVQKITYPFFAGNTDQWVNQGAIGAGYQYDLTEASYFQPQFNVDAYLSHAPSKGLSTITGTFINSSNVLQTFFDVRRIAGSNAGGIAPGIGFHPWMGGLANLNLNYDKVHYDKKYAPSENAIGFGGTIRLNQEITDIINLGASAAIRKPFNNYEADLLFRNLPSFGDWTIGINGAYTVGKNTLPSTYNVGFSADYVMDSGVNSGPPPTLSNTLAQWVSKPAVYLPQVLAIPDEQVILITPTPAPTVCAQGVPTVIGSLPNLTGVTAVTTVATAAVFTGSSLTYSVSVSPSPAPSTVTIDSSTGVITITPVPSGSDVTFTVTVTATNACGSASTSFTVTVPAD